MTGKPGNVRGYWDFQKTDVGELTERYGFRLTGVNGVPSGESLQYLSINAGRYHWEKSDVSVAEFIMYKTALDDNQVRLIYSPHATNLAFSSDTNRVVAPQSQGSN